MRPAASRRRGSLLVSGLSDLDVLITDIGMPGMDGFELRDLVRKARPELPVFLITGRHEIADQGRAQGISGFFRKPFDAPGPACGRRRGIAQIEKRRVIMRVDQPLLRKSAPLS